MDCKRTFTPATLAVVYLGTLALAMGLRAAEPQSMGTPDRIVTMWADAVLRQPGQPTVRGFGGRIIFYDKEHRDPIKVDGTLVVYAFAETNGGPVNVKPDRKFVFHHDQFPKHYQESAVGPSYSIWLPWAEVGGPAKTISLITQFHPRQGPPLTSDASKLVLSSPTPSEKERVKTALRETVERLAREKTELEQRLRSMERQLQEVRAQLAAEDNRPKMTLVECYVQAAGRLKETIAGSDWDWLPRQCDIFLAQAADLGHRRAIRLVSNETLFPAESHDDSIWLKTPLGGIQPKRKFLTGQPDTPDDGLPEPLQFEPFPDKRPLDRWDDLPSLYPPWIPDTDAETVRRPTASWMTLPGLDPPGPPTPAKSSDEKLSLPWEAVLVPNSLLEAPSEWPLPERSFAKRPSGPELELPPPLPSILPEMDVPKHPYGLDDDLVLLPSRPEFEPPRGISLADLPTEPWQPLPEGPGVDDPIGRDDLYLPEAPCDGDAYRILAHAVHAYQAKLAVIANNLANAETVGFKRVRVDLESLPYQHRQMPGSKDSAGQFSSVGVSVGMGARVAGTTTEFRQGAFQQGGQFDVLIAGPGFFQVTDPSGEVYYTRAGNLSKNANGELVVSSSNSSRLLEPCIAIPPDATDVVISAEGIVSVRQPGTSTLSQVGQIELAQFVNPQGLLKKGENLYAETDASGTPTVGNPGREGLGQLHQGKLEASNVDPTEELIEWKRTTAKLKAIQRLLNVEFP